MKNKIIYILAAFLIPASIIISVCLVNGIIINGDNSILFSDLSNIYADHLMGIKHLILEGKSLIYNWNLGGGINYTPYLLGNLNLTNIPILFTPDAIFQEMILLIQILRVGLAGVSCYVYLVYHNKKNNFKMVAFSSCYAVSGYSVCFIQTIAWYESIILLPILVLLVEELVTRDKLLDIRFICILVYAFFTSYYLGYMISFFLFLYTFAFSYKNGKNILCSVFRLGLNGIISAGISSIFLLPVFGAILASGEIADFHFAVKFEIKDILCQFFLGSFDTYKPDGRPLLYCGIYTVWIIIIYMISDVENKKQRIADIILLIVMLACLIIAPLYYIWHMFDNPDWFEGRFTFIIIFYIITLSYGVSEQCLTYRIRSIILSAFLMCVILFFCSQMFSDINKKILIINYILIISYCIVSIVFRKWSKKIAILVPILMCVELLINAIFCSKAMFAEEGCESYSYYKKFYDTNKMAVEYIEQNDTDFYRIEKNYYRRENDLGATGGKSLSIFGTFYNKDFMSMLRTMGITGGQAGRYIGGTPITDVLLSVRYIISYNAYDPIYNLYKTINEKTIFKNPYKTGIGMLVNTDIKNIDVMHSDNPIELQNDIVKAWKNGCEDIFFQVNNYEINMTNLYEESVENSNIRIFSKVNTSDDAYLDIIVKKHENECLYAYMPDSMGQVTIELNGMYTNDFMGQKNKIINLEKDTFGSEYVTLRIKLDGSILSLPMNCIYVLKVEQLDKWASNIKYAELEHFSETEIQLSAQCDKNELLILSIPFDNDWNIYVNGEKREAFQVFQGLTGVEVEEGKNDIQIVFMPRGANVGKIIFGISIIVLIILLMAEKKI